MDHKVKLLDSQGNELQAFASLKEAWDETTARNVGRYDGVRPVDGVYNGREVKAGTYIKEEDERLSFLVFMT